MAILDAAKHLIGEDIHRISDRTPCRAFLALKTGANFLAAGLSHLRQEGISLPVFPYVQLRHMLLDLEWNGVPGSPAFRGEQEVQW